MRFEIDEPFALKPDFSLIGFIKTGNGIEKSCLPSPIGADDP
jgi:hypothetical protein